MPSQFGSDAGPSTSTSTPASSSIPPSRSASPAQTTLSAASGQLRRPASHGRLAQLMIPGRSRSNSATSQEPTPAMVTAYADSEAALSGRTTPEQRRRTARAAAQSLLASDAKYKKFAAQVDKCLQAFENVNEWADFISFLGRLLKTLQAPSPPYTEIPRKLIVAKRLAQCLNPALPSGVHTRALEVYAHVFSIIGVEGLRRDLLVWSSGLFPFFQYASTSVRPAVLSIYETYYLPLGEDLRPATKALTLALLPGVEEETGDFFDQVLNLLTNLSKAVSTQYFLQNIFLILISSPANRLAAVNYLARKLTEPPKGFQTAFDYGLLVRGVSAVLSDDNMLVRRGGLDLLLRIIPLDGVIIKESSEEDRTHLTRAVSAVVLHRDASLSRRVYTWFLGPGDSTEKQVEYFKLNALDLLSQTLQSDMDRLARSGDWMESQTPFKVFLSLLDKWELGESLSQRLAIPTLQAIRTAAEGPNGSEVRDTAAAVDEAMEPSVLWTKLYEAVNNDLAEGETQHLKLIQWLFKTVPQHDVETLSIHVPILLSRLLNVVLETPHQTVRLDALQVASLLLAALPDSFFSQPLSDTSNANDGERTAAQLAYETPVQLDEAAQKVHSHLGPGIVVSVFEVSEKALQSDWPSSETIIVNQMTLSLIDRDAVSLAQVDSKKWTEALVTGLRHVHSFTVVDGLVDAALRANRSRLFVPPVDITADSVMTTVLDSLFRYLRPDAAPYHARAVDLLWEYNQLAEPHTLESVIARRMTSVTGKADAFEAFGVLWRQSDDTMLPGENFQVPLLMVLDGLKSDDPTVLRASETWMRCNLRSYFRALDPLLRRIMDMMEKSKSRSIPSDSSMVQYLVSSICSLFRFGGQGLSRACQSAEVRKSHNAMFVSHIEATFPNATTYLGFLTDLLTTLLDVSGATEPHGVLRVQSAALELLQLLVSRGDLSTESISQIKTALVNKLTISTQRRRPTLQNTMLHLLHSTISSSNDISRRGRGHRATSSSYSLPEKVPITNEVPVTDFDQSLVNMILTGVSSPGNRPILQHWVDFVLMTIPHLENKPSQLRTLCDCFCEQLRMTMLQLRNTFLVTSMDDTPATITEAEPIMLIGVLERLSVVLGARAGTAKNDDKERQTNEGGGFLGYLPTVFSVEAPQDMTASSEAAGYLDDVLDALLVTWTVTVEPPEQEVVSSSASKTQILSRTRIRAKKALEKLFRAQPSETMGSVVQVWASHPSDITDDAVFDCVDVLAPSAQRVVDLLVEHMNGKGRGSITDSSHLAVAAFTEAYIARLEGPIGVQVWTSQYNFAREILAQSSTQSARTLLFPILRCLTILGQIVSTTSALEDRRLRKDLQDTYVKVLDTVLSNLSRGGEAVIWERPSRRITAPTDEEKSSLDQVPTGIQKIYAFIGNVVLRNLRVFLVDNDRVSSACMSISSNIVIPAFRQNKVDKVTLDLLREMTKIPLAVKAWRLPVGEALNDNRFFKMKPQQYPLWKPLVCALMDSDKERLNDLLGRISAAPSSNIFTNRELETVSRCLNLRRLSFVLFAAERNHNLAQLPAIQEKLVEILRTNIVSPRVHSEVYLCLRILMCRFSPQHLTNFWPVILAELLRVFEATMDELPEDGSDDLQLVLAACKFLDLLLVIQSEDFQIHQWIFVTDTTFAEFPPDDYSPEALMDRLGDILAEHASSAKLSEAPPLTVRSDSNGPRKPHLSSVKTLSSLQQLQPFFASASIGTFEGVYQDQGVDWEAVEAGIIGEIFEGRD